MKIRELFETIIHSNSSSIKLSRSFRIQTRLIVLFMILSLIPLIITGFFSYYESSNAIKDKISTYSVQVMGQIGENIERELARLENDSIDIEFSDRVQNVLMNYKTLDQWDIENTQIQMASDLVRKFSFLHDVSDVLVYTRGNQKIIGYGDRGIPLNLREDFLKEYQKELIDKNGKPIWSVITRKNEEHFKYSYIDSDLEKSKSNGILLGRAVKQFTDGSAVIGTLIIRSNERMFSDIFRNIDIGEGADIFVMDSDGIIVSSRNPNIPVADTYNDGSLIDSLKKNNSNGINVFNYTINKKEYLVAFKSLQRADWFVVSTIPFSYLNKESTGIGFKIALLGIGCFILAILLSYLFSGSISQPLKKLVKAMKEAEKGNLSVVVKDTSKDEIGEVTRNFNNMLDEIKGLLENVKNKEKQKRNAELKTLQAQISPHFLSNTLNTVKWLASVQKAENIENIITSLIQLLHVSMGKGDDLISIRDEIEYIKNYINLQEYRYFNKFKVNFEIEDEILDYKILKLILQPVVENSLIHGIGPMSGQGLIVVKGFMYEDLIKITITDNGVGIESEKIERILADSGTHSKSRFSGIGVNNVNERIKMYFGEQYGLTITSVPELYTTVEINLPVINNNKSRSEELVEGIDRR